MVEPLTPAIPKTMETAPDSVTGATYKALVDDSFLKISFGRRFTARCFFIKESTTFRTPEEICLFCKRMKFIIIENMKFNAGYK